MCQLHRSINLEWSILCNLYNIDLRREENEFLTAWCSSVRWCSVCRVMVPGIAYNKSFNQDTEARSIWYHAPWRQRPCVKYYYLIWGAAFYVNTRLLKIAMTASGISSTWHERNPWGLLWFIYTSFLQLQIFKKIIIILDPLDLS